MIPVVGFFKRLFPGDPLRDLERAEALLGSGDAERALELALGARERATPADRNRAEVLAERARKTLVGGALEKASLAEASEYFEDAAEWLGLASEHAGDETRRRELKELQQTMLERAREADRQAEEEPWQLPDETDPEPSTDLEPSAHYQALIDMLAEDVAERYETRPIAFRSAYVALNEGLAAEALSAFEALAAAGGEDPVIRLERGRCRLALGDAGGALEDFEAAWPAFGDEFLDLVGELSVPGLWAEAMLALGRPGPVIERLAELADPVEAAPLCERYAQALLAAERFEDARSFLSSAIARNSARDLLSYQLAQALERLGERAAAIDCLEIAIAPSCAGGCAPAKMHLPSFRTLVALYLEEGGHAERVHELMTRIARGLGGRLSSTDHALLARYYEEIGDQEAAEHARDHARRLRDEASAGEALAATPAPAPALGGKRAPLP